MGSAAQAFALGLILDSSVLVSAERAGYTIRQIAEQIPVSCRNEKVALSAVGLTELVHGIYRAKEPQRRAKREAFLTLLSSEFAVLPYTHEAALIAGRILGEQQKAGFTVPYADLLIAATAISIGYGVATENLKDFHQVPGLRVVPIPSPASRNRP